MRSGAPGTGATGCCHGLANGQRACADADYCGGGSSGGGDTTCHDRSGCLSGTLKTVDAGGGVYSGSNKPFTGTFTNHCADTIACEICQPGKTHCEYWQFKAGATWGGWATFMWCPENGSSVNFYCAAASDPYECQP